MEDEGQEHLSLKEASELVESLKSDVDSHAEKDAYRLLLAHALTAMPKQVASILARDWVFRDFVKENDAGFAIPRGDRANKHWIFINGTRIKTNKEKALCDILHELAHLHLNHSSEREMKAQEAEAKEKEHEWFSIWERNHDPKVWADFKNCDSDWKDE